MGPRKQNKSENGEHQSPIYLKHVSNFKASLRRRDSQRFLRTKPEMPLNPVSSSLDSGHESLLCPFVCESEARRLYWAGRLRVSIDLLQMKNHQSQLDLVMLPPSYPTPHPLLHHRSRSLFNILQDDRPPAQQFVANEEGQLFFAMEPKRSSRRPPQPTKVRTHKRAKRSS
ncbi:hypothetical protein OUZ56_015001 [Daphnia magna]|uniref:Uncharacterized protein n=1 Tax=Daphnia magna TaxID=35525 RepID=A0ABR0ALI7_9CRUS|nr:hypothetical protein OUZ56_015001 [Daphnia magna]